MSSRRRRNTFPKHCHHRASGRGVVRLNGHDHYTGPWGTPEAEQAYDKLIAVWLANGRSTPNPNPVAAVNPTAASILVPPPATGPTIADLVLGFWNHAQVHYRRPDGTQTSEVNNYRQALRTVRAMYGDEPVAKFDAVRLEAVRDRWVADGICRAQVNIRVGRVKRVFKWGAAKKLAPVAVYQELCTVQGLQKGRTDAVETDPVKPVADEHIRAALPHLRPQVRDMVEVQRLTGMRPGEVCQLRWRDIDRSGNVWAYRPAQHKMQWQGKDRVVSIGPRAQAVLKKYEERDPAAPLFSPKEAVEQFHRERGQRRVTTYYPSRQGWQQRKAEPKRKPKDMYTVTAYGQAIRRACKKAKIPLWKPNQIRHTRATEVRDQYGLEAAQVVLGHANADVTDMARSPERDTSPCEEVGLIVSEMAKRNHNNSESPSILHRSQDRA